MNDSQPVHTFSPRDLVRPSVQAMSAYAPGEQINQALKLNTNECLRPMSPLVRRAVQDLSDDHWRLYPSPLSDGLRQAAAAIYDCHPEQIMAGNGSDDCLTVLFRAHCQVGDQVVMPWPTYSLYDTLATLQGVEAIHVPYDVAHNDWTFPADQLLQHSAARLCLIASPNNPSSTQIPRDQLTDFIRRFPGIVVVDEAYIDFAPAGTSVLPLLDDFPNLVVLRTFSKSYSMAGARLGLCFAHRDLIAEYNKVKDSYNVNAITQAMGIAALNDQQHLQASVADTLAQRQVLADYCLAQGWTIAPSQANFILATVDNTSGNSPKHANAETIYRQLKSQGILIRWWPAAIMADKIRITVGTAAQQQRLFAATDAILGKS